MKSTCYKREMFLIFAGLKKTPADQFNSHKCLHPRGNCYTHTHLHTFIWAVDSADQSVHCGFNKNVYRVSHRKARSHCKWFLLLLSEDAEEWQLEILLDRKWAENHFAHIGAEKFRREDKNTPHAACLRDPVGLYSMVFCNCLWHFWRYWKVENTSDI